MYLIAFPLLLIPYVLYNMVAYLLNLEFSTILYELHLPSGSTLAIGTGDMLVILGVMLLYLEILKVTRLTRKAAMDHLLSTALLLGMAAQFALAPRASTSTFLILMALSLVDVVGGFTITLGSARRAGAVEPPEHVAAQS